MINTGNEQFLTRLFKEPISIIITVAYSVFLGVMLKIAWNKLELMETRLENARVEQLELLKTIVKDNTEAYNSFLNEINRNEKNER